MKNIRCTCDISCKCNCRLIKVLSNLLEAIVDIDHKRQALSEILDCEVLGFDGITDKILNGIGELLEIESCCVDSLYEIVFDFVFKRKDLQETIERLLEM